MASRAFLEGFYHKPRIDRELLEAILRRDHLPQRLRERRVQPRAAGKQLRQSRRRARRRADRKGPRASPRWFHNVFGDRYFIEIQDNGLEIQRLAKEAAIEVANAHGPAAGRHQRRPLRPAGRRRRAGRAALHQHRQVPHRHEPDEDGRATSSSSAAPDEMFAALPDQQEALAPLAADRRLGRHRPRTRQAALPDVRSARRNELARLPPRTVPRRAEGTLRRQARSLGSRRRAVASGDRPRSIASSASSTSWASPTTSSSSGTSSASPSRATSPARRAARASARSSATRCKLSHVCPLKYDLLFERFLDESRLEAPDIDIDFCKERRGEVIDYVKREVRRRERRADRHVRHARRAGGHSRRRPHAGHADLPRRSSRRRWCPTSWASRSRRRSKPAPS